MCFLYAASAAGDAERMRGHLTPIAVRHLLLAPCRVYSYICKILSATGARFISPAGYLQLNSWHLHKYLVVQALRLISAPCKGQGHVDVASTYVATYLHCNLLRTMQLNTQQRTKGICRSVKQQFHELSSPAQALRSSELVRS